MTERRRYQYPCGTRQQYTAGGCRCPSCRRANADYMAARRAELRAEAATPMHAHGLPAGGTYYCCPCGDCRSTANDRKRTWRAGRTTHTEARRVKPMPTHIELSGGRLDGRRFELQHSAEDIARYKAGLKVNGELKIYGPQAGAVVTEILSGRAKLTFVYPDEAAP